MSRSRSCASACVRLHLQRVFTACLFALVPAAVGAQQAAFTQALSELTLAVEGTYGDEGALVRPAIDRMSAALAQWDREIEAAAAGVREASQTPAPGLADRRFSLARMYADRGRLGDALSELAAAAHLEPRRADTHVLRGLVLEAAGRPAEAIEAFRTARAIDATNPVVAYYLLQQATRHGSAKDARDAAGALRDAYSVLVKSTPARTIPFTRLALLQPSPGNPPLLPLAAYSQAYRHVVRREYDRAIVEFRKAADADPLVADSVAGSALMIRAIGALRQARLSEVEALVRQSGQLGQASEAHRVLGLVYWAQSEYDKSVAELTAAIRRSPRNERARLALARVLGSAGRDADAEVVLQETIRDLPDCALPHWWLALAYERVNRFAEARQEIELAAAASVAGESLLHATAGRTAGSAADLAGAVNAYTRAVRADPNDPAMHKFLAAALVQQDRSGEAFAEFVAALLIDPQDADAHAGIGQIHLNAGRDADAVDTLRRALDLAPGNIDSRYAIATALARLGRTEEAAQHFARVAQAQRQMLADRRRTVSAGVLKEEAALRVSEGRFDAAIGLYEKALAVDAEPAVYGRLADLYSKVGRTLDAARAKAIYDNSLAGARVNGSAAQ
jgi:tetratricopeptide (TPR) repeat protein